MSRAFPMAGFRLTLHGRFWVTPEVSKKLENLKAALAQGITGPKGLGVCFHLSAQNGPCGFFVLNLPGVNYLPGDSLVDQDFHLNPSGSRPARPRSRSVPLARTRPLRPVPRYAVQGCCTAASRKKWAVLTLAATVCSIAFCYSATTVTLPNLTIA